MKNAQLNMKINQQKSIMYYQALFIKSLKLADLNFLLYWEDN